MISAPRRADSGNGSGDGISVESVKPSRRRWLDRPARPLDAVLIVALSLVVVFVFARPLVAEVFDIPSSSMEPTLSEGDHVLAAKSAYLLSDPQRGDVAALRNPEDRDEVLIKRIVGLPGDRVEIRDGVLYVNGEREREDYVNHRLNDGNFFGPAEVPPGKLFVMGDNRANSRDSRTFGPVDENDLEGKVLARVWPTGRAGGIK